MPKFNDRNGVDSQKSPYFILVQVAIQNLWLSSKNTKPKPSAAGSVWSGGATAWARSVFWKKSEQAIQSLLRRGGEGGIRTLDTLLRYTRFPIVRARPATRLLHAIFTAALVRRRRLTGEPQISLLIIPDFKTNVKHFLPEFEFYFCPLQQSRQKAAIRSRSSRRSFKTYRI